MKKLLHSFRKSLIALFIGTIFLLNPTSGSIFTNFSDNGLRFGESGNLFSGNTEAGNRIFTTDDFTSPVVFVSVTTVLNDGTGAPIAITSSEAGVVYLAKDDIAANASALLAAIAQNKAVVATLAAPGSVNVSAEGLVPGTYKAYGFDASGNMGTAGNVVTVQPPPVVPYHTIKQIQGEAAASPFVGQKVRTNGTVTAVTTTGFFMQDANTAWSGIFVSSATAVAVGASVEIIGTVAEVDGLTTIGTVEAINFIAPVITPTPFTIGPAVSIAELYESLLVKVTGYPETFGIVTNEWTIFSTSITEYTINNTLFGPFNVLQGYKHIVSGIATNNNKILAISIDTSQSIFYTGTPFCKSITTPQNVATSETVGSYSASPSTGLSLNSVTGEITPNTSTAGMYIVTFTGSISKSTLIEIVAPPTPANAGPDQTDASTCGLKTIKLAAYNPTDGTGEWSIVSGTGGSFINATLNNTTFTGTVGTEYVLRWTVSNPPCDPSTDDVTIKLNQPSETPSVGDNQNICGLISDPLGGNAVSDGTASWSKFSGPGTVIFSNINSGNSTASVSEYGIYIFRWTFTANKDSTEKYAEITVNYELSSGIATVGTTQNICGLISNDLHGNTPVIGTGHWSIVGGGTGTFSNSGSGNSIFTADSYGIYILRWAFPNNGNCIGSFADITINYSQIFNPIIVPVPGERCGPGQVTLGATVTPAEAEINWFAALTGGTSLKTGTSYTTQSILNSTSYWVEATYNGFTTSPRTEINAMVKPIPTITLGIFPTILQGNSPAKLSYSSATGSPNNYRVSFNSIAKNAGFTDVTQGLTNPINIHVPSGVQPSTYYGTLTVWSNNYLCESSSYPFAVTVSNDQLAFPTITLGSNPSVCPGITSANLTYTATTGSPNKYTLEFGTLARANGFRDVANKNLTGNTIVIAVPSSASLQTFDAVLKVQNTSTSLESRAYPITVTVGYPTIILGTSPSVPQGITLANQSYSSTTGDPDQYSIIYQTAALAIGFTNVTNATLPSSLPLSIPLTVPPNAPNATYNATLKVRNSTALCESSSYPISITVTKIMLTSNKRCGPGSVTLMATAIPETTSINWYEASTGGPSLQSGTSYTTPSISNTTSYWIDATLNGITTTPRQKVDATVNPVTAITLGANPSVIQGITVANLPYSASTGSPDQYNIVYNTTATTAGFNNVNNATLPISPLPIPLTVPSNVPFATYSGTLTVKNSTTLCESNGYLITVTVTDGTPTITLGTNPSVVKGATKANLPFSATTNSPDQYSIDYNATANNQGFVDVSLKSLPLNNILKLTVPTNPNLGIYYGNLTVFNSITQKTSILYPITVTVESSVSVEPDPNQSACQGSLTATLGYSAPKGSPNQYKITLNQEAVDAGFIGNGYTTLPPSPIVMNIPSSAPPGTYGIILTVKNTATGVVSRNYSMPLTIKPMPTATITRSSGNCGSVTLTANTNAASPTYIWYKDNVVIDNEKNVTLVATSTGAYKVKVKDGLTTCENTSAATNITSIKPLPTAIISGILTNCETTTLTANTNATTPTYVWYKNNGIISESASSLNIRTNGDYKVKVKNEYNACENTSAVSTVVINPLPEVTIDGILTACRFTTLTTHTEAKSPTYIWYKNNVEIVDEANSTIEVTTSGAYKVKVKDGLTTCENTSEVSNVVITPLPSATLEGILTSCFSTTLYANTNVAFPIYVWYRDDIEIPDQTNSAIEVTTSGDYKVKVTDELTTCENTSEASTIVINPLPAAVAGVDRSICMNDNTTLGDTPVEGSTYLWSSVPEGFTSTEANPLVIPLLNTTYKLVETITATECSSSNSVEVMIKPLPSVISAYVTPQSLCGSGQITFSATASSGIINWYDSKTGGVPIIPPTTISANTTIYAEAESFDDCKSATRNAVTATVFSLPTVLSSSVTPASVCGSGQVTFSATPSSVIIKWYDAETGGTEITNLSPTISSTTTYYAEAISPEGCISAERTMVRAIVYELPTVLSASVYPASVCGSGNFGFSALASSGMIKWYDSETGGSQINPPRTLTATTTIYAEAESYYGCKSADRTSVTPVVNPLPPLPDIPTVVNNCGGSELIFSGAPGADVNWCWQISSYGKNTLNYTSPFPVSTQGTYYLRAYNTTNQCWSASVSQTANPGTIPADPGTPTVVDHCGNSELSYTGTPESFTAWIWQTSPTGIDLRKYENPYTITSSGTYYLRSYNGYSQCWGNASGPITASPMAVPTISGTLKVCAGSATQLSGDGTPAAVDPWISSDPLVATVDNTGLVSGLIAGTTVITYTENNGCSTTATVKVNALPATPDIPTAVNKCGSSLLSHTAASESYTGWFWQTTPTGTDLTLYKNPYPVNTQATYYVRGYNGVNQCWGNASDPVTSSPKTVPTIIATTTDSRCGPGEVTLTATSSAGTINWYNVENPGGGLSLESGNTFTPTITENSTFYVAATYYECTTATRTPVEATIRPIPTLIINPPPRVCEPPFECNITDTSITYGSTPSVMDYTYWMDEYATVEFLTPEFALPGLYYIRGANPQTRIGSDPQTDCYVIKPINW
jgi:hypothetical protein